MSDKSKIEWTDATWTPIRARNLATGKIGWHCEHASEGCRFCYAEGINKRLGTGLDFKPGHRSDIEIFLDEKMLTAPLRWKKPRMIFICSMTDLFAEFVKDEWINKVFAVMALCPQHTFQVLTKRAGRMREYFADADRVEDRIADLWWEWQNDGMHLTSTQQVAAGRGRTDRPWPLPNIWLGVSCEDQTRADERIPLLLDTPAAVRFISAEPMLGPIDLTNLDHTGTQRRDQIHGISAIWKENAIGRPWLDWVIVGGESGPKARPMHPDWARSLRDQCADAGVPFFSKLLAKYPGLTRHRVREIWMNHGTPAATPGSAVSLYENARRALAAAVRVDEVKAVLDVQAAMNAYARQAKDDELLKDAAELRERAERRLGELLIEAKKAGQLTEGRPRKTVEAQTQFPRVTLEAAGIDRHLSSRAQKKAGIAAAAFEAMVERMREGIGRRPPDLLREGPINGARAVMGSRQEPDDSLDFFPTPPWATRALFEHVLPHLGIREIDNVTEPACGEGHMYEVICEYAAVIGMDIHDYGKGFKVSDFLKAGAPDGTEWIITNPPFSGESDKALEFALRAMEDAQGVALFVRSQWVFEGVERYERLFLPHPPTLIAPFTERVNLCKGRWDPDGSTATAYSWVVWTNAEPHPLFWIPPGCRKALTKPDDRKRFAAWSLEETPHDADGVVIEGAEAAE